MKARLLLWLVFGREAVPRSKDRRRSGSSAVKLKPQAARPHSHTRFYDHASRRRPPDS